MQQYLIIITILINLIIFKLINSKRFKFNQRLLTIFCILQFIIIFFVFINNQEILFLNILDFFKNTFMIILNKLRGAFLWFFSKNF